jgi:SPX domain protein involved in polyphosphate accumulation
MFDLRADSGTGFKKLLKKHAKWCRLSPNAPYSLSSQFIPHLETQRPFHRRVNFEHIMRELSALYTSRLDPDHSVEQQAQTTTPDAVLDNSMTSSVTYWVHNDNQVEVELFLLKHLILQLPSSSLASRDIQRAMRTVFLDSSDWSVYEHVVPETKNAGTSGAKVPQIVWEENSKNKDMVIAVPQGGKYSFLPMKRKNVSTFLSKDLKDVDLSSSDWVTSMPAEEWAPLAQKVHDHIEEYALLPGMRSRAVVELMGSHPSVC